jgi:DNA repair photolyase
MQIEQVRRRAAVLTHPSLPCLERHYTINLTAGCPNRCRYCYAQSFAHHPDWGRVLFYANSLELLRAELARKRHMPELVFFSTACEPFVPDPIVLEALYGCMELLLAHGVFVLISTKCRVPGRFVDLFVSHRHLVHLQVGITTTNDPVRRLLEPGAPSVPERLDNLARLTAAGIALDVRADPLVPGLTDTAESFASLCRAVSGRGATSVVASHLFLRRANMHLLRLRYCKWSMEEMASRLYRHEFDGFCGGRTIRLPSTEYRRHKLSELRQIATLHGLSLRLCSCTNPDITEGLCRPEPVGTPAPIQACLF